MASQEERDRIMAEHMEAQGHGDEEDEAEFEPGNEESDDDDDAFEGDDDEEEEEEDYAILKGTLARHDGRLTYKGRVLSEAFEIKSIDPKLHWKTNHPTRTAADQTTTPRTRTIHMEGKISKDTVKVELTLSAQGSTCANGNLAAAKKTGCDDEEDGKMPSKPAATQDKAAPSAHVYTVYGKGSSDAGTFEFLGQLDPSTAEHNAMPLECRKRTTDSAAPAAAAAAAAIVDEDDEDDADEGLAYDELIALHEDAGMSVEDLRKRYNSAGGTGNDEDDTKPSAKKAKTQEDSDDDDEEYGF